MPKHKTHKGTKKRFRLTASGKAKHKASGNTHLAVRKKHKTKRLIRVPRVLSTANTKHIQAALGKHSY
ncbi:MAG: 50S ribosomal protein L35 [Planctomycetales bacterium]